MKRILLLFFLLGAPAVGAPWDMLPFVLGRSITTAEMKTLRNDPGVMRRWKQGDTLPTSFLDAGLTSPVRLVGDEVYLDGGSQVYLFKGANGEFLAVCTDSPLMFDRKIRKPVYREFLHLYLGAFHYTQKPNLRVPIGSETERFLLDAINDAVARSKPRVGGDEKTLQPEGVIHWYLPFNFTRRPMFRVPVLPTLQPPSADAIKEAVGRLKPVRWGF